MAKRDKNRSYMDWEYEWMEQVHKEENQKRLRDEERRSRREQKSQYTHYDWNDEE